MIKTSIDKSHSKTDLIDLINTLNVPIVFSHQHNKKDIQDKLLSLFEIKENFCFENNVYNISNLNELQIYVSNPNPKKTLSVKEKSNVMRICREICKYCSGEYIIEKTNYASLADLHDDMLYIIQYGDLPSVRRTCKLMNKNIERKQLWKPIISPQVKKMLIEKEQSKKSFCHAFLYKEGEFIISFN